MADDYKIEEEKRENHPRQHKAVLLRRYYDTHRGVFCWEKFNVWKPGYDKPKLPLIGVPDEIVEAFRALKDSIQKREEEEGFTF